VSVRRTKVNGESVLLAQVSPTLWKVVYPDGRAVFLVPEAEANDGISWHEEDHPRGEGGKFATVGHESLTGQEQQSIYYYARQAYHGLNRNLRLGLGLSEQQEIWKRDLDSALEKSTLAQDMTVYRGFGNMKLIRDMKEGDVLRNAAYTSTAPDARTATSFKDFSEGLLEISLPAGTRALDVHRVSSMEPEILLPRDTSLRYVGRGEPAGVGSAPARTYKFELVASSVRDWSPFQPRVPKGQSGGGQWSGENLTKAERAEVRYYTGDGFEHVNSTLRQGEAGMLDRLHLLDSAVAKSVIDKSITTYRGVNSAEFTEKLDSLQPGETITDRAFTSTSGSFLSAAMYGGVGSPTMEIRIPSGSSVLYAESMSANSGIGEEEYLLPRDSTFRYVGSRTVGGGAGASKGSKVYTFDLVPRVVKDYDPSEPRVPAGQPGGGQWQGQNLGDDEKKQVRFYTRNGYTPINKSLRTGTGPEYLKDVVATIDSAIAKSVLSSDTVVYRGVNAVGFVSALGALKPGDTITDSAYVSTSGSLASAATFAGTYNTVMEVRLPAGSNALYVEEFSGSSGQEEDEYILPRGTKFQYVTSRVTRTKRTIYTFDLVPRGAADWNPFQPRVPAGQHGGGEWTEGTSGTATGSLVGGNPKKGFDPKHVDALKQYAASIYQPVNEGLRNKTKLRTQEEQVVLALDEAFERNQRTTEVMQLFRAAGEEFAAYVDALKVGDNLIDEGFASTTTDERLARSFLSGQPGEKKVMVEIVLPKDSKAIDTSPFNPFKGENEVLLPRNTTFKYLGMERDVYRFRANPR
jgi:hypothetical protein